MIVSGTGNHITIEPAAGVQLTIAGANNDVRCKASGHEPTITIVGTGSTAKPMP